MALDYAKILNEARAAATAAILVKCKTEREQEFNCGFAWVTVDGTDGLARWCRAEIKRQGGEGLKTLYLGSKGYPRGWQFWKPGEWPTAAEVGHTVYGQDMDFHAAGAQAFQQVLARYGIVAEVGTRLD